MGKRRFSRTVALKAAAGALVLLLGWAGLSSSIQAQQAQQGMQARQGQQAPVQQAQAGGPPTQGTARAILAGGCFWCVEADFDKLPGVLSTTSGYIGGTVAKPTYEQVANKVTGHAEAVEIVFDPRRISYEQLLAHYWRTIDPTTKDRQFCDAGSPYRTAIFAVDATQLAESRKSRADLERTKPFKDPIVTEVVLAGTFYPAEDYHQDYYLKNPVRYKYYRSSCGRDARLAQLWGRG
ncbi:MAG: peptide-methionine (S)-S-oxide reductase MsrA [Rubrivivax sp.]|nr:peptide-methionine (S)-S-oxide reductase MsrA [Rubrivivax sp.]